MAIITQEIGNAFGGGAAPATGFDFAYQIEAVTFDELTYYYFGQFDTYGAVQYAGGITLPRNAIIEEFDVLVTAARATAVRANEVAQVRTGASNESEIGSKGLSVAVDFGTPRTVSAVSVPSPYKIAKIRIWNGAQFVTNALYNALASSSTPNNPVITPPSSSPSSSATRAVLSAEPRTERLQIEIAGSSDAGPLVEELSLVLPDSPGDLELRINGGAPAWSHPGPVAPSEEATRSDSAWNEDSERIVHLKDALNALTGDPTASDDATFELKLTSRAPGLLKVEELSRDLRRIRRVSFDGRATTTIGFEEEGLVELALNAPGLPAGTTVYEIRLTMEGDFEEERILPPIGPERFETVDLKLDQERAVAIRLAANTGLAELTGLRLPLSAEDDGAEVRVVLWSNAENGADPDAPMENATSEPLVLDAGSEDAFRTFRLETPVPVKAENMPWAAILVTRGRAVLSLAASSGDADPLAAQVLRLGPHAGPWTLLPAGLRSGALAVVRARARLIGTAAKETPIAPLTARVDGAAGGAVELFPARKPTALTIPGGTGGTAKLSFVARAAGTITLRDVDIVSAS
ncbi:MAG: hypothetical protein ACRED5_07745 [Propylenella sp.]